MIAKILYDYIILYNFQTGASKPRLASLTVRQDYGWHIPGNSFSHLYKWHWKHWAKAEGSISV